MIGWSALFILEGSLDTLPLGLGLKTVGSSRRPPDKHCRRRADQSALFSALTELLGRHSTLRAPDILDGPRERIAPSGLSLSGAKAQCANITGLVDPGSGG